MRLGRPVDVDLIAKQVGSMAFGFYGTSEVCETAEAGAQPAFVSFNGENSNMPESTWLSQQFPHARVSLRAENHMLLAIAARSGASLRCCCTTSEGVFPACACVRWAHCRRPERSGC